MRAIVTKNHFLHVTNSLRFEYTSGEISENLTLGYFNAPYRLRLDDMRLVGLEMAIRLFISLNPECIWLLQFHTLYSIVLLAWPMLPQQQQQQQKSKQQLG